MKNSISVLIPTKDRRRLLEEAVGSALAQTVLPDEIVIVNDGSCDDTTELLSEMRSKHSLIKVIERKISGGVNAARNDGIRHIKSEWIVFLDDDDTLLIDAISIIKNKLPYVPEDSGLFYFNTIIRTDTKEFTGGFQFKNGQHSYSPSYEEVMIKHGLMGDCGPIFKRSVFNDETYLFPENVNGFESFVIKKIAKDGYRIVYYNDLIKVINLQTSFEHLSFTASKKNPDQYLRLHKDDLKYHLKFYSAHPEIITRKYIEMMKLAYHSRYYYRMMLYLYGSLCARMGFVRLL